MVLLEPYCCDGNWRTNIDLRPLSISVPLAHSDCSLISCSWQTGFHFTESLEVDLLKWDVIWCPLKGNTGSRIFQNGGPHRNIIICPVWWWAHCSQRRKMTVQWEITKIFGCSEHGVITCCCGLSYRLLFSTLPRLAPNLLSIPTPD